MLCRLASRDPACTRKWAEGERKQVTVLCCDIVGSTALAERVGAEAMHDLLNRFFEMALVEVHRYGGTINKFLGDGFLALVGVPSAYEDHARRAVLAALAVQRRLRDEWSEREGLPRPVRARIGVNSGMVVVGSLGDDLEADYTAIGDTTNVAARLEALAEPGGILIGDSTARLVAGYLALEPLGPLEVRGKQKSVVAHRVTGIGPRRSPLDRVAGTPGRFVGRERQLAALAEALAEARAGEGKVVGVVGDPGMGKTRLVAEFRRSLADERITWLEGRCLSYGSSDETGSSLLVFAAKVLLNQRVSPRLRLWPIARNGLRPQVERRPPTSAACSLRRPRLRHRRRADSDRTMRD